MNTRSLGYASGHISNVENGYTAPSRALIDAYVDLGADRTQVEALFETAQSSAARARDARHRPANSKRSVAVQQIGPHVRPDDVRLQYTVPRYDVRIDFDGRGRIATFAAQVLIRAVVPGVRFYYTGLSLARDASRPEPELSVLEGGSLERVKHYELGTSDVYLRLDRDLDPDEPEPYRLSYVVRPSDDVLADTEMHYAARAGTGCHSLALNFTAPALPTKVWRVCASDAIGTQRLGPDEEIAPNPDGRYAETFEQTIPGWSYGMSWLWPKDLA